MGMPVGEKDGGPYKLIKMDQKVLGDWGKKPRVIESRITSHGQFSVSSSLPPSHFRTIPHGQLAIGIMRSGWLEGELGRQARQQVGTVQQWPGTSHFHTPHYYCHWTEEAGDGSMVLMKMEYKQTCLFCNLIC